MAGTDDGIRQGARRFGLPILLLSLLAFLPAVGPAGATRSATGAPVVAGPHGQGRAASIVPVTVHLVQARRSTWGSGRTGLAAAMAALLLAAWALRGAHRPGAWPTAGIVGTLRVRGPPAV